ncbi:glutathione S-transferase family protein [Neorhizobium galegae]|uniref:glutathione S-transferase family protein n=1 Tax=Neorhizobium galegae TaxID=399 RepID=UPI000621A4C8|nr:glutathione S-transferase family protein [Neorhizobium galegae]CDZ29548.1 Glutathione S-transferase [Neorhizobium galegae bv. officinalis]KAA9386298.1 glutathione S-transferase family protein [Neorhizobium galegae]KAB1112846.1 glutathione S-transferase family protein [Neorhizobium galegae]MCM2500703.1 glutathione S-transferase family protein [Neorhizobium galegae]MCQ1770662.1 glutathione S-transferase family protein [Neorhizobium galegae]
MRPVLYSHPFSSYCQKVLTALYENGTEFDTRMLGPEDPSAYEDLCGMWPVKRFPILLDGEKQVFESSIVIEYLGIHYPGPVKLIPDDADAALDVRMMDRFFDNYISTPQQKVVFNAIRAEEHRDPYGVTEARGMLDAAYGWLDERMADRKWAAADAFSLADCAAAPALFYADWTHPIGEQFANVRAYRSRLLARPSFARAVDEARPYRAFFPLGAPDRD